MEKQEAQKKSCQSCEWFKSLDKKDFLGNELNYGECWLHAPVIGNDADGCLVEKQVTVEKTDLCGEYKDK